VVALRRELAEHDPATRRPLLARSLVKLRGVLRELDQDERGLDVAKDLLAILRDLSQLPGLARSPQLKCAGARGSWRGTDGPWPTSEIEASAVPRAPQRRTAAGESGPNA
jgi:hypothetical protein